MSEQQAVEQAVDATFGTDVRRTVTVHSSGAVSIVVRGARVVVIDGTANGDEWGFSIDPDDAAAFAGHTETAPTLDAALRAAHAAVAG
ncbi:hypothetical protein [Kribbella sp. NPDC051770]|uniref:hypothetical protein n=1 Tax=Kribbella sp. NPDC051770 TaxID=3155413 RepID=UPI0034252F4E